MEASGNIFYKQYICVKIIAQQYSFQKKNKRKSTVRFRLNTTMMSTDITDKYKTNPKTIKKTKSPLINCTLERKSKPFLKSV